MVNMNKNMEIMEKLIELYNNDIITLKSQVDELEKKNESLEVVLHGYKNRKGIVDDIEKSKKSIRGLEQFKTKILMLVTFISGTIAIIGFILSNWDKLSK
jgi:hypothetical protein